MNSKKKLPQIDLNKVTKTKKHKKTMQTSGVLSCIARPQEGERLPQAWAWRLPQAGLYGSPLSQETGRLSRQFQEVGSFF